MQGNLPVGAVNTLRRKDRIKLKVLRLGAPVFDALMALNALRKARK